MYVHSRGTFQVDGHEADRRPDLDQMATELIVIMSDPNEPRDHFTFHLDRWLQRHRAQLIKYLANPPN